MVILQVVPEWVAVVRDLGFPIALVMSFLWIAIKYLIPGVQASFERQQVQNEKQAEMFTATLGQLNQDSHMRSAATVEAMHHIASTVEPLVPSLLEVHRKLDTLHERLPTAQPVSRGRTQVKVQ